jgi:Uma2 family endonuclease
MASVQETRVLGNPDYPTSDGKPMAETDHHRNLMVLLIAMLQAWFEHQQRVYVSGNLQLFYERGNKRRHISPDVFVVKGVPKGDRLNYILWEEGKAPQLVIELTSSSTRREDTDRKFRFYRDRLKVQEYFLFDPHGDYLNPRLQGYRLRAGEYHPVRAVQGRLPSRVLDLHLEADGDFLRLYDPASGRWLPTPQEQVNEAQAQRDQAQVERDRERQARQRAEAEVERLRRQVEELRRLSSIPD